jgi:hypothetical protein
MQINLQTPRTPLPFPMPRAARLPCPMSHAPAPPEPVPPATTPEPPTPNPRPPDPTSCLLPPASNPPSHQTPDLQATASASIPGPATSNTHTPTSNLKPQTPNIKPPTSNLQPQSECFRNASRFPSPRPAPFPSTGVAGAACGASPLPPHARRHSRSRPTQPHSEAQPLLTPPVASLAPTPVCHPAALPACRPRILPGISLVLMRNGACQSPVGD